MKVTPEEKQKIKLLAEKKGVSQKEVIMNLVNEEIVEYEVTPKPGSMLEKMQKYVGIINDAPSDLSTNPKYLEGLGEDSIS
ncbi:MAG: hypothetical protein ED557_03080 [Balneola sp.]|nr:MAG: hypothetical protein ED557_03080 [Balneola sp.]